MADEVPKAAEGNASATASTPISPESSGALSHMQSFVDLDEISFHEKVGHGSYGVVYKAIWREKYVAVKEFEATVDIKAIETEVKQMSRARHHNIIALFGISENQSAKYLIMEYAEGGSLHNFLHGKVKPYYTTAHAMSWARQCAEGVAYLHAMKPKPLIHRDLKPLNLLLTNKGRNLKICDFGTVADKSTKMTNNKGSAAWMAPEVFEGSKYTEKCDIFSWAIVLWEVLSRQQPFKEIDNTFSVMWKIHKGERPPLIQDCPMDITNLMISCWATEPEKRPSMQNVLTKMNELVESFPGAEEPLEYEFANQQIILPGSAQNYTLDFSVYTTNTASTQMTTSSITNTQSSGSSSATPTNAPSGVNLFNQHSNVPTASITATTRWDVIPEDVNSSEEMAFNLTPNASTEKRYETIRNGMEQMAGAVIQPISVDVDPCAWDLNHSGNASNLAKSDGKERLTVTDAKPMLNTHGGAMPNNSALADNTDFDNDDNDDDDEDDENDGPDQSFHEMLDPELQPEQPLPDSAESQKIYREHRRLAKEYLRVDTKLYYAQDTKEKLLEQMDPAERLQKQELLKKMSDKEELLELYNNLRQQLEKARADNGGAATTAGGMQNSQSTSELMADDGWVVIAPNQQDT